MLRGYWRYILAAFGWLSLAAVHPPYKDDPNGPAQREQAPTTQIGGPTATEGYRPYPSVSDPRCYHATNHDSADLCAQWRAAVAAEKAADAAETSNYVAGIGTLLSFIGIILVLMALRQTRKDHALLSAEYEDARREAAALARDTASALAQARRSADAASIAADAATKQSIVASSTFMQEFRPYIALIGLAMPSDGYNRPFVQIFINNIGRTIAKDIEVYAMIEVLKMDNLRFGAPARLKGGKFHLFPREPKDAPIRPERPFTPVEITRLIKAKEYRLWLHGHIVYADDFGAEHRTFFRQSYSGGPINEGERPRGDTPRFELFADCPPPT